MPAEIVFTSVPRGLDGGSGFQPVRRTRDMSSAVAERLKLISGYSHPFRHGDARNPVVYIHRIERVAGGTHHVVARLSDAGSDHTGRSNFLGHMLAVEASVAGTKQAGPAAVALGYRFEKKWSGVPEERETPTIIGGTKQDPQPCEAWRTAGLDPGIAGDLAEAAMRGEEVNLITPAGQADPDFVLRLFADALALVEPARRWKVTFNTCEIEPFDAMWRAVRADLPHAGEMRERRGRVIDLTGAARGTDGPYARFARGESDALPWQQSKAADERRPAPEGRSAHALDGLDEATALPAPGRKPPPRIKPRGAGPPPEKRPRRFVQAGDGGLRHARRPDSSILPLALACLILLLAVPIGIALVYPEWFGLVFTRKTQPDDVADAGGPIEPEPRRDAAAETDAAYQRRKQEKELRRAIEEPTDGRTLAVIRADVAALQKRIRAERDRVEPLTLGKGQPDDPDKLLTGVLETCKSAQSILDDDAASAEQLKNVQQLIRDADKGVRDARALVDTLAASDQQKIDDRKMADRKAQENKARREAFADLAKLASMAELPLHNPADVDGSPQSSSTKPIDLGLFRVEELVNPTFELAVPKDTYLGSLFQAEVKRVSDGKPEWAIQFIAPALQGDVSGSSGQAIALARLVVKNDHLYLEPDSKKLNDSRPVALLRRCVLLVSATPPEGPAISTAQNSGNESKRPREIRFVKPEKVPSKQVDIFGKTQTVEIRPPPGIPSSVDGAPCRLPIASCEVKATFAGKDVLMLPQGVPRKDGQGIVEEEISLAPLGPNGSLGVKLRLSLPEAEMRITPQIHSPGAQAMSLDKVKQLFFDKPQDAFLSIKKSRTKSIPGTSPNQDPPAGINARTLEAWFSGKLATTEHGGLGVVLPGHETVRASLDLFLKEEYRLESDKLEQRRAREKGVPQKPSNPESFQKWYDDDLKRARSPAEWKDAFQDTVKRWGDWFWPQCWKRWEDLAGDVQKAVAQAAKADFRIEEVTSLAYDKNGNVYRVPLVVCGEPEKKPSAPQGVFQ